MEVTGQQMTLHFLSLPVPRVAAGVYSLIGSYEAEVARAGGVLGAMRSLVLHCPQRTQRSLLRLGQAPGARDIRSLIGSIPPQRLERLATLEIPEQNGPVITATG